MGAFQISQHYGRQANYRRVKLDLRTTKKQSLREAGSAFGFAIRNKNHEKIFTYEMRCVKIILALAITVGGSLLRE